MTSVGATGTRPEILSELRFEELEDDAESLFHVAEARVFLGLPDVLRLIYRARSLDFGRPEAHLAYIGLFMSREELDKELLQPAVAGIDTTVRLTQKGETKVFTILAQTSVNRERGELTATDPLALALLGHKKGDTITLREGPYEELVYEIADVQSKYVFAFQESLNNFSTWFPGNLELQKVEVTPNDFSKIFVAIDERDKLVTTVMNLYREKPFPLPAIARLSGSTVVRTWAGLIGRADGCVIAGTPSALDALGEVHALAAVSSITLDLTALLTLGYLEILERLRQRFSQIYVPQFVLDALNATLAQDYLMARPFMTVGKEAGSYVRADVTQANLDAGRNFVEAMRSFVESATVIPSIMALDIEQKQFEFLTQILGQDGIAAVLAAKERSTLLYSDDLRVRQIAAKEWQVQGVWSQSVLADMRTRGLVTDDEYHDALRKLALANYLLVNMNVDDFFWVLTQNAMRVTGEVNRFLALLQSPTDENAAIKLAAGLLKRVWLEPVMDHQKLLLLDAFLQSLTVGRLSVRVIRKLRAVLQIEFRLLPLALAKIYQNIDLWQQQHFLPTGPL